MKGLAEFDQTTVGLAMAAGIATWYFTDSMAFLAGLGAYLAVIGARQQYRWYRGARLAVDAMRSTPSPAPDGPPRQPATGVDLEVRFNYIDADGYKTRRTVTIISVTDDRMHAWCHTKRAERTFLFERIDGLVGLVTVIETAELIDPYTLAAID